MKTRSKLFFLSPLHQTSFQYVLENVAELIQTVYERSERSDNCLQSFYEFYGHAQTEKVLQNVEPAQNPTFSTIKLIENVLNVLN